MEYPLELQFKLFAFVPQVFIKDAKGNQLSYVRQKFFKLREKVEVFLNKDRRELLCTIEADRIIDFRAEYFIQDPSQTRVGSVKREGMRSIWRTRYDIRNAEGQSLYKIKELNPFAKVFDSFFGGLPLIGILSGYLFHPRYGIFQGDRQVMELTKRRSFFESCFRISRISEDPLPTLDEFLILMSLNMFVLLERQRG